MADTEDLSNLSMPGGNSGMNGVKVGETFQRHLPDEADGNAELRPVSNWQSVETRRLPPAHPK